MSLSSQIKRLSKQCLARYRARFNIKPLAVTQAAMEYWYQTSEGQRTLQLEQALIAKHLECVFGYHLMQLSMSPSINLSQDCAVNHHFQLLPTPCSPARSLIDKPVLGQCVAAYDQLPLAAESIDVAILHHVLDYIQDPHQLLRETSQTIIPHGHILIVGFNPTSLYGCGSKLMSYLSAKPRWRCQLMSIGRTIDWLRLLDFEPISIQRGYKGLKAMAKVRHSLSAAGGIYTILAKKHVAPVTPIKPLWKKPSLSQWSPQTLLPTSQTHEKH